MPFDGVGAVVRGEISDIPRERLRVVRSDVLRGPSIGQEARNIESRETSNPFHPNGNKIYMYMLLQGTLEVPTMPAVVFGVRSRDYERETGCSAY